MAFRTNSKQAKQAVRAYLVENVNEMMQEREIETDKPFHAYLDIIKEEKFYRTYPSDFEMFRDWLQGLGGFGADLYYHASKRGFAGGMVQDMLQDWLNQTDAEVRRFSGTDSENLAVCLCYREFMFMYNHEKQGGVIYEI